MSNLTATQTVGEIAAQYPATVRVFQKHQIDFCCGGKLPLKDACEKQGIVVDGLLAELGDALAPAAGNAVDWNAAPLTGLIAHILSTHHEYLKAELPRLTEMVNKVMNVHGERHPEVIQAGAVFFALRDELGSHMMKEEMVLFPLIERLENAARSGVAALPSHCGSVQNPIRVMVYEHDNAGAALEQMRSLSGNYTAPQDACNTFRAMYHGLEELEADLHQHIHLENNILFPRAVALEQRKGFLPLA
ncbi:MAG: iron-sulfur cluster repair di-iron protein [Bryobacteraceae bacterium]